MCHVNAFLVEDASHTKDGDDRFEKDKSLLSLKVHG
jgi:hypothetical protein